MRHLLRLLCCCLTYYTCSTCRLRQGLCWKADISTRGLAVLHAALMQQGCCQEQLAHCNCQFVGHRHCCHCCWHMLAAAAVAAAWRHRLPPPLALKQQQEHPQQLHQLLPPLHRRLCQPSGHFHVCHCCNCCHRRLRAHHLHRSHVHHLRCAWCCPCHAGGGGAGGGGHHCQLVMSQHRVSLDQPHQEIQAALLTLAASELAPGQ